MKKKLIFEIECGEKTCASKKGKFCRFFIDDMNGRTFCFHFGETFEIDGWIQRHKECIEMTKEN